MSYYFRGRRALLVGLIAVAIVLCLFGISVYCQEENPTSRISTIKTNVCEKIHQFEKSRNIQLLKQAYDLASVLYSASGKATDDQLDQALTLMLKTIERCWDERDKKYDLRNPPRTFLNIAPQGGGGQILVAGMDPKDIKDTKVRERYETDIAENRTKIEKHERELEIQRELDRELRNLSVHFRSPESSSKARAKNVEIIKSNLKNEDLRKLVLEKVGEAEGVEKKSF